MSLLESWRQLEEPQGTVLAPCTADPDLFFSPDGHESKDRKYMREMACLALCRTCSIQWDCLSGALERKEQFGVWGGKTEDELRAMSRRYIPVQAQTRI